MTDSTKTLSVVSVTASQSQQALTEDLASQTTPWQPFESTWTESPYLGPGVGSSLRKFFAFRWFLTYPLQQRLPFSSLTISEVALIPAALIWIVINFMIRDAGGSGENVVVGFVMTFATASHNSIWSFLLGLPFERAITYHKALAYMCIVFMIWHGLMSGTNATGIILVIIMGLITVTSFFLIRRRFFDFFYRCHVVLFAALVVIAVIHGGTALIVGGLMWAVDAAYRYFFMAGLKLPRKARFQVLPSDVVRVSFPKPPNFHFRGGQYIFLCVPEISLFEWHPFSLSSPPHSQEVTLHIRALGDWTTRLLKLAAEQNYKNNNNGNTDNTSNTVKEANARGCELSVLMEGPYGSPMLDLDTTRYQIFLLISGGIGITPMQSVCNDLLDQNQRGRPIKKIFFVWTVRDHSMIHAMYHTQHIEAKLPHRLPFSFSPDILERLHSSGTLNQANSIDPADSDILHTEFFLTKQKQLNKQAQVEPPNKNNDNDNSNNDNSTNDNNNDDDTQHHPTVRKLLRFERPSLATLFDSVHAYANKVDISVGTASKARKSNRVTVQIDSPSTSPPPPQQQPATTTSAQKRSGSRARVAVMVCGPPAMMSDAKQLCRDKSCKDVVFDFHAETFEF